MQVHRELSWLYAETGARITTCVGGMDPRRETPRAASAASTSWSARPAGCAITSSAARSCSSKLEAVVLDEADEMLDMGFREDLERLLDAAPPERRTLMFSATIPQGHRDAREALPEERAAHRDGHRGRSPPRHRVPGGADHPARARPRGRQPAALPRRARLARVLRDPRRRHAPRREPQRARVLGRRALGRAQPARAQPGAAGAPRRARARVRRDRCRRARPRPAGPRPRDPRRPPAEQAGARAPQRAHRPRGPQGHRDPARARAARRFVERLFARRRTSIASWKLPPSSDDIRIRDQDQLVLEIRALADEPTDDDRQVARTLLAERTAEELVAALVAPAPAGPPRPRGADRCRRRCGRAARCSASERPHARR